MGREAISGLGRVRVGAGCERDLEGAGYLFDGYLVADDALLVGAEASDHFGLVLARHGIDAALDRLNGCYRYVVKQEGRVWFGIDHFGGAALFYQLAPELSLFDDPSAHVRNPDYSDAAVCCLLASGFTLDDETIYTGIRECGSGVLYEFETATGQLRQRTWFKFNLHPRSDCDPDELEAALLRSLPRLAPREGSYLLPLSGGLDSRTILALALKRGQPLEALTYGVPGAMDSSIPGRICAELGLRHTTMPTANAEGKAWFESADMREMVKAMHLGRSLPEESDWRPMARLGPGPFVVCPGHGGDWLTGSFIDARLLHTRTLEGLVEYLLDFHCSLTAISSPGFAELLRERIRRSLAAIAPDCGEDLLACAERWNLEHRQRKYIVNSARKYRYLGMHTYLPFFDRNLMSLFMNLKTRHRTRQRAYVGFLGGRLYTGCLAALRRIDNTRWDFDADLPGMRRPSPREVLHQRLRELDRRKYRKRFLVSSMEGYDDAAAMLSPRDKASFLRQKVDEAFPLLHPCVEHLRGLGCQESARHVSWILRQQVSQMNPVGLFVCAFLPYLLEVE